MEPHIGSEQGGTRPVVVLQNDVGNRYAPTLIVATVTSRTEKKKYQPTHVLIAHNVDVAPEFMDFLKDYYAQWKAQKKLMGASWQKNLEKKGSKYAQSLLDLRGNDFVICNDYGFPINPDSYGALVRRVGKKAGIEKIHPHMFRHTFVSILLSNPNIGVATVAAEAGHAQPSTTLAIYTQVYDRRRDEIRKQMSRELYK